MPCKRGRDGHEVRCKPCLAPISFDSRINFVWDARVSNMHSVNRLNIYLLAQNMITNRIRSAPHYVFRIVNGRAHFSNQLLTLGPIFRRLHSTFRFAIQFGRSKPRNSEVFECWIRFSAYKGQSNPR